MVTISPDSYTYNGSEKKPKVTVKDGNTALKDGIHYTVTYKDNVNVGTAKVIIVGKENYTDSITKGFTIKQAAPKLVFER